MEPRMTTPALASSQGAGGTPEHGACAPQQATNASMGHVTWEQFVQGHNEYLALPIETKLQMLYTDNDEEAPF